MYKQSIRPSQGNIMNSVPVAIITVDHDYKITSFNNRAEELTGYSVEEVLGCSCHEILCSSRCAYFCPVKGIKNHEDSANGLEAEFTNRSGEVIPVRIGVAGLQDDDGNFVGYLEWIEDISREKKIEREEHNFISMVAHDMKSPLVTINGLVRRLKSQEIRENHEKLDQYIRVIGDAGERLNQLIEEFLEYSHLESGRVKLEKRKTDIHDLLQKTVDSYRHFVAEHKGSITCYFDLSSSIVVDKNRIQRVFVNLLDNAVKYSPEQIEITIKAKETPQEIIISFGDKGVGIRRSELPYIFDAFHRIDSEKIRGHGLGLAVVRGIVGKHGGKVLVESTLGQGSVFTVILPKKGKDVR